MLGGAWREMVRRLLRRHRDARSFEDEAQGAGGIGGGHDVGARTVPTSKIVGSVGRWQNLRSDFFYRKGGVTQRFLRVGEAMRQGIALPPIQVYRLRKPPVKGELPPSEYYVVDGHHRVAMARNLGQDFLDAEVKEFKAGGAQLGSTPSEPTHGEAPPSPGETAEGPAAPDSGRPSS